MSNTWSRFPLFLLAVLLLAGAGLAVGLAFSNRPSGQLNGPAGMMNGPMNHGQMGGMMQGPSGTATVPAPIGTAVSGSPQITIRNYAYSPASIRVKTGTSITWMNQDSVPHTATSTAGQGFDTGILAQGESATIVIDTPGTYDYICSVHPAMKGVLVVEP